MKQSKMKKRKMIHVWKKQAIIMSAVLSLLAPLNMIRNSMAESSGKGCMTREVVFVKDSLEVD